MDKLISSKHVSAAAAVFFTGSPKTNTLFLVPVDYTLSKELNLAFPVDFDVIYIHRLLSVITRKNAGFQVPLDILH